MIFRVIWPFARHFPATRAFWLSLKVTQPNGNGLILNSGFPVNQSLWRSPGGFRPTPFFFFDFVFFPLLSCCSRKKWKIKMADHRFSKFAKVHSLFVFSFQIRSMPWPFVSFSFSFTRTHTYINNPHRQRINGWVTNFCRNPWKSIYHFIKFKFSPGGSHNRVLFSGPSLFSIYVFYLFNWHELNVPLTDVTSMQAWYARW